MGGVMMYPLDVAMSTGPSHATLRLVGELDMETAPEVDAAARDALRRGPGLLSIDLRDVRFIDSTGLRTLITIQRRASRAGLRMEIVRGPDQVQRVFDITGTAGRLPLVDAPSD
jgi:anti-anti-sigma factor